MELTVNKNTYVTREQADNYIKYAFAKFNRFRKTWETLDFADKDTYLRLACNNMQAIDFGSSIPLDNSQVLVFPRVGLYGYTGTQVEVNDIVYTDFMTCQVVEALHMMMVDTDEEYLKVVTSKTVGKVSETYKSYNKPNSYLTEHNISFGAYKYIKDWCSGSY